MHRNTRGKLSPWIENLILSYGGQEEEGEGEEEGGGGGGGGSSRLKAHVIGVGQMTQSQALGADGPTGLLFLSDGVLRIPAVLTVSAWERLQEQEDRECFASLVNTTVCVLDFRLRFHMAAEQSRCGFFLSVGELATTAAGPARDNTPCCATLPSVRQKIQAAWRARLGRPAPADPSQRSQGGLDLSQLLGEWQHDCVRAVLDDVRERLAASPPPPAATSWDADRVRFKGEAGLSVPVRCLLVPEEEEEEEEAQQVAVVAGRDVGMEEGSPLPAEQVTIAGCGGDVELLANPWDIFPPPGDTSSSSDLSQEARPAAPAPAPAPASESQQVSEHSFVPPYQRPPAASAASASTSASSLPGPLSTGTPREGEGEVPEGGNAGETAGGERRKAKRKRSQPTPEPLDTSGEGATPPSWLFDSREGSEPEEEGGRAAEVAWRKTPVSHGDGKPFSYSYRASGQNLLDLSRLEVAGSLLRWAVRYLLLPKRAENPHGVPVPPDRTEVS